MALADTFVRQVKHSGKAAGDKYTDGGGMYLLVKPSGRYWRMDYAHGGKRKTLALGVYPEVSLAKARQRREKAREQLADGIDPSLAKQEEKQAQADAAANTFEAIARVWLTKTASKRAEVTQSRITILLEKDVFPFIGTMPISKIKPRDVLDKAVRKVEARGSIDTAHRAKQICGQVFRYAVAVGLAERDVTADLRGALAAIPESHFSAITEPKQTGDLMRAIFDYAGHPCTVAALKLSPLVFVRPGELRIAEWAEIDLDAAEWRIPGRVDDAKGHKVYGMKMATPHIVPLAPQAVEVLQALLTASGTRALLFPGERDHDKPMSNNTILAALKRMGYAGRMTGHGFRGVASTILHEQGYPHHVIELQLAHQERDDVSASYNHATYLTERRAMMAKWADHLDKLRKGADVIQIDQRAA